MSHGDPEQINRASAEQARAARRFAEPDGWEADARAEQKGEAMTREERIAKLVADAREFISLCAKWNMSLPRRNRYRAWFREFEALYPEARK